MNHLKLKESDEEEHRESLQNYFQRAPFTHLRLSRTRGLPVGHRQSDSELMLASTKPAYHISFDRAMQHSNVQRSRVSSATLSARERSIKSRPATSGSPRTEKPHQDVKTRAHIAARPTTAHPHLSSVEEAIATRDEYNSGIGSRKFHNASERRPETADTAYSHRSGLRRSMKTPSSSSSQSAEAGARSQVPQASALQGERRVYVPSTQGHQQNHQFAYEHTEFSQEHASMVHEMRATTPSSLLHGDTKQDMRITLGHQQYQNVSSSGRSRAARLSQWIDTRLHSATADIVSDDENVHQRLNHATTAGTAAADPILPAASVLASNPDVYAVLSDVERVARKELADQLLTSCKQHAVTIAKLHSLSDCLASSRVEVALDKQRQEILAQVELLTESNNEEAAKQNGRLAEVESRLAEAEGNVEFEATGRRIAEKTSKRLMQQVLTLKEHAIQCEARERRERHRRLCLHVGLVAARMRSGKLDAARKVAEKALEEAVRAIESTELVMKVKEEEAPKASDDAEVSATKTADSPAPKDKESTDRVKLSVIQRFRESSMKARAKNLIEENSMLKVELSKLRSELTDKTGQVNALQLQSSQQQAMTAKMALGAAAAHQLQQSSLAGKARIAGGFSSWMVETRPNASEAGTSACLMPFFERLLSKLSSDGSGLSCYILMRHDNGDPASLPLPSSGASAAATPNGMSTSVAGSGGTSCYYLAASESDSFVVAGEVLASLGCVPAATFEEGEEVDIDDVRRDTFVSLRSGETHSIHAVRSELAASCGGSFFATPIYNDLHAERRTCIGMLCVDTLQKGSTSGTAASASMPSPSPLSTSSVSSPLPSAPPTLSGIRESDKEAVRYCASLIRRVMSSVKRKEERRLRMMSWAFFATTDADDIAVDRTCDTMLLDEAKKKAAQGAALRDRLEATLETFLTGTASGGGSGGGGVYGEIRKACTGKVPHILELVRCVFTLTGTDSPLLQHIETVEEMPTQAATVENGGEDTESAAQYRGLSDDTLIRLVQGISATTFMELITGFDYVRRSPVIETRLEQCAMVLACIDAAGVGVGVGNRAAASAVRLLLAVRTSWLEHHCVLFVHV